MNCLYCNDVITSSELYKNKEIFVCINGHRTGKLSLVEENLLKKDDSGDILTKEEQV